MSTDFKPGDRVRVEFDGEVTAGPDSDGDYTVRVDGRDDGIATYAKPETLTKYAEPVKVGDVLTDKDAEPPVGTVVLDGFANQRSAWLLDADGAWQPTGGEGLDPDDWNFVAGPVNGPATVLHLPGDTE